MGLDLITIRRLVAVRYDRQGVLSEGRVVTFTCTYDKKANTYSNLHKIGNEYIDIAFLSGMKLLEKVGNSYITVDRLPITVFDCNNRLVSPSFYDCLGGNFAMSMELNEQYKGTWYFISPLGDLLQCRGSEYGKFVFEKSKVTNYDFVIRQLHENDDSCTEFIELAEARLDLGFVTEAMRRVAADLSLIPDIIVTNKVGVPELVRLPNAPCFIIPANCPPVSIKSSPADICKTIMFPDYMCTDILLDLSHDIECLRLPKVCDGEIDLTFANVNFNAIQFPEKAKGIRLNINKLSKIDSINLPSMTLTTDIRFSARQVFRDIHFPCVPSITFSDIIYPLRTKGVVSALESFSVNPGYVNHIGIAYSSTVLHKPLVIDVDNVSSLDLDIKSDTLVLVRYNSIIGKLSVTNPGNAYMKLVCKNGGTPLKKYQCLVNIYASYQESCKDFKLELDHE